MRRARSWRQLRALLAALFVFAMAAAPTLDTIVCCDDTAASAGVHASDDTSGAEGADLDQHAHGHCHFAAAATCANADIPGPATLASAHGLLLRSGGLFGLKSDLMRPPRA